MYSPLYYYWKIVNSVRLRIGTKLNYSKFNYYIKIYNISVGKNLILINSCPDVFCSKNAKILIGNNVALRSYSHTSWYCNCRIVCRGKGLIKIGNNVGINGSAIICSNTSITLGDNVHIGGGTRIYDSNFHSLSYLDRRDPSLDCNLAKTAPVKIEDDVFIGTNVIIGKGITIGARSVIAAGSVVVKDIPADCIAGGNPCKVLKQICN